MARCVVEQEHKHHTVGDTDEAEAVECAVPSVHNSQSGAEAAHGLTEVDAGHIDAYGQRASALTVVVGYE